MEYVHVPTARLARVLGFLFLCNTLFLALPREAEAIHWARLRTSVVNARDVTTVEVPTRIWSALPVRGFSFGLSHDPALFSLISVTPGASVADANGGLGPDLFLVDLAATGGSGAGSSGTGSSGIGSSGGTVDCLISLDFFESIPPFGGSKEITVFEYELLPGGPNGFSPIVFDPDLGVDTIVEWAFPAGLTIEPHQVCGGIVYHAPMSTPLGDAGEQLWFLNGGDGTISVVSLDGILLDTLSAGGQLGPAGVAVGEDGITWVTFRDSDSVVRFDLTGTVIDVIPVGDGPVGIALDSEGNAWVANSLENTLTKIAGDGVILLGGDPSDAPGVDDGTLGGAIPCAAGPQGLAVDGLDNVAIACTTANALEKRNSDGSLVWSILLPILSAPTGVAVDRDLYIWVTSSLSGRVQRRASDGSAAESFSPAPGAAPRAITIRGRNEAWVVGPADGTLRRYRPGGETTTFSIGGNPSGVAADGRGDLWVTDKIAGTVSRYDETGALLDTVAIGPEPEFLGDAFGLAPANVLLPTEDFDDDGSRNDIEIDAFTNPYDLADVPSAIPGYVSAILDLSCSVLVQAVTLVWTPPNDPTITALEVRRAGVLVATLAPGASEFIEASPLPIGSYPFTVTAVNGSGGESLSTGCTVVIGAGSLQGTTPIQVPGLSVNLFGIAAVPDPLPGSVAYYLTDPGNDRIYGVDEDFDVLETITSPFAGFAPTTGIVYEGSGNGGLGSLIVCAGPNGDPNQDATVLELTLDGTPIGDPLALVRPLLGIAGVERIKGGLSGLSRTPTETESGEKVYMAVSPENCELFSFTLGSSVPGILPTQDRTILPAASAFHPEPGYGLNGVYFPPFSTFDETGGEVLVSTIDADGAFAISRIAIANGEATVVATSVPLSAPGAENVFGDFVVEGDRVATIGITTSSVYELGSNFFVRGDANASANGGTVIDIGDAIEILNFLFLGSPARPCLDAYDVDDDGALRIGDAILLLTYLFGGGESPLPPGEESGPDTTPDGLPCF